MVIYQSENFQYNYNQELKKELVNTLCTKESIKKFNKILRRNFRYFSQYIEKCKKNQNIIYNALKQIISQKNIITFKEFFSAEEILKYMNPKLLEFQKQMFFQDLFQLNKKTKTFDTIYKTLEFFLMNAKNIQIQVMENKTGFKLIITSYSIDSKRYKLNKIILRYKVSILYFNLAKKLIDQVDYDMCFKRDYANQTYSKQMLFILYMHNYFTANNFENIINYNMYAIEQHFKTQFINYINIQQNKNNNFCNVFFTKKLNKELKKITSIKKYLEYIKDKKIFLNKNRSPHAAIKRIFNKKNFPQVCKKWIKHIKKSKNKYDQNIKKCVTEKDYFNKFFNNTISYNMGQLKIIPFIYLNNFLIHFGAQRNKNT